LGFEPLSKESLDLYSFAFKLIMKNQASKTMVEPKDENLLKKLWH
jgi:hypothetical protein